MSWRWGGAPSGEKVPRYSAIDCDRNGPLLCGGPLRVRIPVDAFQQASFLSNAMNRYYRLRARGRPVSPGDWKGVKWVLRREYALRQAAQEREGAAR